MEDIAKLGTNIGEIAMPTFQAYIKRQRPRKESIFARPPTEHSYGPHERQKLDVYLPPKSQTSSLPCIVFVYGGGLVRGDKRMGGPADGVIYANVGKYFSDRGYVAVLPDYRLYGQHDAVFPSGGEDVGLTLRWIVDNLKEVDPERIFLIGNSAGGVHITTYLWSDEMPTYITRVNVRAAILAQVPMHFRNSDASRKNILDGYFKGDHEGRCPYALRQKSQDTTETLVIVAERDPEDEILTPNRDFLELFKHNGLRKPDEMHIEGHNHISPFLGFGLGGEEDAWGSNLMEWIADR